MPVLHWDSNSANHLSPSMAANVIEHPLISRHCNGHLRHMVVLTSSKWIPFFIYHQRTEPRKIQVICPYEWQSWDSNTDPPCFFHYSVPPCKEQGWVQGRDVVVDSERDGWVPGPVKPCWIDLVFLRKWPWVRIWYSAWGLSGQVLLRSKCSSVKFMIRIMMRSECWLQVCLPRKVQANNMN